MTAKEKANELLDNYWLMDVINPALSKEQSKLCALIAVDEILNQLSPLELSPLGTYTNPKIEYWLEVKQEIEKL